MNSSKCYKVKIPTAVELDITKQFKFIAFEEGSEDLALQWLKGLEAAIESLTKLPERCSIAPENFYFQKIGQKNNKPSNQIIRHLIYKKSFRIIFTVVGDEVRILDARHAKREVVR